MINLLRRVNLTPTRNKSAGLHFRNWPAALCFFDLMLTGLFACSASANKTTITFLQRFRIKFGFMLRRVGR